ncbi:transcription initiation factor IIB family protein [Halobacterium sp. CBA1126]|uniref:transcription initiation factor IIB family protein n=1 Tax=Halobacterium TaxID=2239 RepID=UPI0012FC04C5|nr:transcription initiation factor IIB family protein [Halobacterium sp. CBA1126]MUV61060.1 transcription initiation factor IIB family protein [Halobacterium sp. CBA1126]
MYRAGDEFDQQRWLDDLEGVAADLELDAEARTTAKDLFLSAAPSEERSKPAAVAASVYAGALIAGDQRSQTAVADAADVSRLAIQQRWKELLEEAGFDAPTW